MARPGRRRWRHGPWAQALLAHVAAGYVDLVDRTGCWELRCDPATADLIRERRPFIAAAWHGRALMIYPAWRALLGVLGMVDPPQPYVMTSTHGDGLLVSRTLARFGVRSVLGSSRRGGTTVLRAAHRLLRAGQIIVITPDGPRGPRMRAQPGIVHLASRSGAPIVPIACAATNQHHLSSWDHFALALPLARGILAFGPPLDIGRDIERERARQLVERRLSALTAEVDRALGRVSVAPAA